MADTALVLLAAALLRIPARRIRALVLGDDGALRDWIANESATRLAEARRDARTALARLETLGARLIAMNAPDYPAGLRDLGDPPPFLIVRGTLPARSRWRAGTAIVGSRDGAATSLAFAYEIARAAPGPIVSGLARGVDRAAHEGALAAGTPTIAYVGSGIGVTYPAEHRALEDRIVDAGGAIVSEALPDEAVSRWSLVRRDRLQAAHAAAILLVESEVDGGAMHALRAARKLGRPRFALEPPATPERFGGNARAIAEGATALPWDLPRAAAYLRAPHATETGAP